MFYSKWKEVNTHAYVLGILAEGMVAEGKQSRPSVGSHTYTTDVLLVQLK